MYKAAMNKQQGDYNGDDNEMRIPLHIVRKEKIMQQKNIGMRWPGRSDSITQDDSWWMDDLLLFESNSLEKSSCQDTEFDAKHNNQSRDSVQQHRDAEARGKRKALHSNEVERKRQRRDNNVDRECRDFPPTANKDTQKEMVPYQTLSFTRDVAPTAEEDTQKDQVSYQNQYANLMFSAFSIKGWGHAASSRYPCRDMHLIKEPTLFTQTSYPFRVIFANDAFLRLRRNDSVIGTALLDCFVSDDLVMKPQLSRTNSILRSLHNGAGCAMRIVAKTQDDSEACTAIPCVVNAYPVVSNVLGAENLVYYAMRFDGIRTVQGRE